MNAKVVYYTQTGNTQKIANAIADALSCPVSTMDAPLNDAVDVLFLGASVYKFGIDKKVLNFIAQLDPSKVGSVVIFSTSAMSDSGYPKLVKALTQKGIAVQSQHYYCKGEFMFVNKNRPNAQDVADAKQFAKSIVKNS